MKHKAHNYFWITAALIILVGVVERAIWGNTTVDINVHDTYYVISNWHVAVLLVLVYFIVGAGYWVLYKAQILLQKKLTKAHTVITVLAVPAYYILLGYCNTTGNDSADNLTGTNYDLLNSGLLRLIFITVFAQILFPVNIIVSLIKRKKHNPV